MKNHWLSKKKSFQQKMLDEACELERMWMKIGLLDLTGRFIRPTNKNHWLDGDRLTKDEDHESDFRGAD